MQPFGTVFGELDLASEENLSPDEIDAPHFLEKFFADVQFAAVLGGEDEREKFAAASTERKSQLAEGYRTKAADAAKAATRPIAAHINDDRVVRKEVTRFPSGGCVVAEMDAAGVCIRSYIADDAEEIE